MDHRNILLVEDHAPNLLTATAVLDNLGYDYAVATSGQEAFEQFRLFRFDLILMDIQMPVLSGVDTTRQIRQMEKDRGLVPTPIIAMTANFATGDLNQWQEAGIEDIIPKPFNFDYFAKILAKHCKKMNAAAIIQA